MIFCGARELEASYSVLGLSLSIEVVLPPHNLWQRAQTPRLQEAAVSVVDHKNKKKS
jgi:hypothetical protein